MFAKELSLVSWLLCMCRVGLTARDKFGVGCPRPCPDRATGAARRGATSLAPDVLPNWEEEPDSRAEPGARRGEI